MKVQVLQEDLNNNLQTAIRFIASRTTLPILSNFLLETDKTKLKISATNLEMSISTSIGAKVEEEGNITIPAKYFEEIISNLNKGQIDLIAQNEKMEIVSQNSEINLPVTPSNDFPKIPNEIDDKKSFTLVFDELKAALTKILFAVGADVARPVLTGVLFIFESSKLTLVASDGFRLSKTTVNLSKEISLKPVIIPKNSLLELLKIGNNAKEILIESKETENQLVIKINDVFFTTRLIDGNFPDFGKIIPVSSTTLVSVDKNDLIKSVKLASIFAKDVGNLIKMTIGHPERNSDGVEGSLTVTSEGKAGNEKGSIEAEIKGPSLEVLFNYKFVEDFLNNAEGDSVEMKLTDAVSPVIFVDSKNENFLHLIMPVRVQS
ncbi:MAG TPA: DNA polymerase III subunit beta [Patescibacteria group bacterium]|nr:DNA polymerase III subunit beta [Patescibacteria group bacterium]